MALRDVPMSIINKGRGRNMNLSKKDRKEMLSDLLSDLVWVQCNADRFLEYKKAVNMLAACFDCNCRIPYERALFAAHLKEKQAVIHDTFITKVKSMYKKELNKAGLSIENIQNFSKDFLDACINAWVQFYPNFKNMLTEDDLTHLANVVTSIYIERWLENDTNARLSISDFARQPYRLQSEERTNNTKYTKDINDPWYEAHEEFEKMLNFRRQQAEQNNESVRPRPYKRGPERPLDFITLSWCNAKKNGRLYIYNWLDRNNKYRTKIETKATNLEYVLESYNSFLSDVDRCFDETGRNTIKNREYVSSCIMLQKIERTCRIQLCGKITEVLIDQNLELSPISEKLKPYYWTPYVEERSQLFEASSCVNKYGDHIYTRPNEQYDVLDYDYKIKTLTGDISESKCMDAAIREQVVRETIKNLLTLLYAVCPVNRQRHWVDEDFLQAAKFYHDEYHFVAIWLKTKYPKIGKGTKEERKEAIRFYTEYEHIYEFFLRSKVEEKTQ